MCRYKILVMGMYDAGEMTGWHQDARDNNTRVQNAKNGEQGEINRNTYKGFKTGREGKRK